MMQARLPRGLALLALCFLVLACGRPPDLVGVDNAASPVAKVAQAKTRKVFIATTREASETTAVFFSSERAPELGYASVLVSIPPTHQPGQLERPRRLPPDPATEFAVIEPTVYGSGNSFVSQINRELRKLPPKDRKVLLFVHGYNNTFSDSILRMAQFVEDTSFSGVPVLFSWASGARPALYVYDFNSVLAARPLLYETAELLGTTSARGFDIFAHSMGAMLTMEAIVQASRSGQYNPEGRLDNVMLASPDIDMDVFESQLAQLPAEHRNFFVFVATDDRALGVSRRISGGVTRVGAADALELEKLGVSVIDLSLIDDSASGSHSKFAGSPEVVQLIGRSLKNDNYQAADTRITLVEILDGVPIIRELVP